jgi:2Fe-2S ferredoxin
LLAAITAPPRPVCDEPAMVRIRYVELGGVEHEVEVDPGVSLMEAAVKNGVAAIEGECGGACACATCHIYIPPEWSHLTGVAADHEQVMLEFGVEVDERSRLGCQIKVVPEMDGMIVLTPRSQR